MARSYFEIKYTDNKKLPLNSITVGPCSDFPKEEKMLRRFLDHHGYDEVEIVSSSIPLRT